MANVKCRRCCNQQDKLQTMPHTGGGVTCLKCVGKFYRQCVGCTKRYLPNEDYFKFCECCLGIALTTLKPVEVNNVRTNILPTM